jgi:hypothetical protein
MSSIVLSQFSHVAGGEARSAQKKSRPRRRHESREERPEGDGVSGVPSHHINSLIRFAENSKLIIHINVNVTLCVINLQLNFPVIMW